MGIRPWNIDALRLWQRVLPMIDLIANPVFGYRVGPSGAPIPDGPSFLMG